MFFHLLVASESEHLNSLVQMEIIESFLMTKSFHKIKYEVVGIFILEFGRKLICEGPFAHFCVFTDLE